MEMGYKSTADKTRPARLLVSPSAAKRKIELKKTTDHFLLGSSKKKPQRRNGKFIAKSFSLASGSRRSLGCSPKKYRFGSKRVKMFPKNFSPAITGRFQAILAKAFSKLVLCQPLVWLISAVSNWLTCQTGLTLRFFSFKILGICQKTGESMNMAANIIMCLFLPLNIKYILSN